MKRHIIEVVFICGSIIFQCFDVHAQSRLYIYGGTTTSLGGNFVTFSAKIPSFYSLDLEYEKKIMGSLHMVTGISTFGVGYNSTNDSFFGSHSSNFKARYLAEPLMARWNVGNHNFFYVDFGVNLYYMAQAHLNETVLKFGNIQECDGDIAPYSNRFYSSVKLQETLAFNRFILSIFYIFQFKGQSSINNLADHWGLNGQQSTYLISNGYSDFNLVGIKIGYRIR